MAQNKSSKKFREWLEEKNQKQRIQEIRKRLIEYHRHENDPYSYFPSEIDAIREFEQHALADMEYLLGAVEKL